jgi:hypothetical protein
LHTVNSGLKNPFDICCTGAYKAEDRDRSFQAVLPTKQDVHQNFEPHSYFCGELKSLTRGEFNFLLKALMDLVSITPCGNSIWTEH